MSAEKTAGSLEPKFHKVSKAKHWTPSTDKARENHLHQARLFHQSKAASSTAIATKDKVPISHPSVKPSLPLIEETPGEVKPKDDAPASTTQQSNTDGSKGRVLQKQIKGPADGASSRQNQQLVASLGNQTKTN